MIDYCIKLKNHWNLISDTPTLIHNEFKLGN